MENVNSTVALADARQMIEGLRRRYAQAIDGIARGGLSERTTLQAEFKSIFAKDATIRFVVEGKPVLQAVGPDAWAEIAGNAVGKYRGTQHLIGTQVVRFRSVGFANDGKIAAGAASMISNVQATHWTDNRIRVVVGDYCDEVRFHSVMGWQIHAMDLIQHLRWERPLDPA